MDGRTIRGTFVKQHGAELKVRDGAAESRKIITAEWKAKTVEEKIAYGRPVASAGLNRGSDG